MENQENKQPVRPLSIYEQRREQIARNKKLLEEFADDQTDKGTMDIVVDLYCDHLDIFLNLFLVGGYVDKVYSMEEGVDLLNDYFGYWLSQYCHASDAQIRDYAPVIKKFYRLQRGRGRISSAAYDKVRATEAGGMKSWRQACRKYEEDNSIFLA